MGAVGWPKPKEKCDIHGINTKHHSGGMVKPAVHPNNDIASKQAMHYRGQNQMNHMLRISIQLLIVEQAESPSTLFL